MKQWLHDEAGIGRSGTMGNLGHYELRLNFCSLLCCKENTIYSRACPLSIPRSSHSYLWPSGAQFSVPSLSPSALVTTELLVFLLLTSSPPVLWSWDEKHCHMDAAPLCRGHYHIHCRENVSVCIQCVYLLVCQQLTWTAWYHPSIALS